MPDGKTVDLSEFEKLSRPKKPLCRVGAALVALPDEEAVLLRAALEEDQRILTGSAIVTWLARRGLDANQQSVGAHRRGCCTCADD
jgi:hypothetical protein